MVSDGYARPHGLQPGSLAAALALSAAMVSGLVLSSPAVQQVIETTLTATNIPLDPPPPPDPVPRETRKPFQQARPAPRPIETTPPVAGPATGGYTPPDASQADAGIGTVPIETILPPPALPAAPVLRDAAINPRYLRDFQPEYPAGERRAEREGLVVVKVLIGVDGRVRQVERVSAASDAFFAATERQALAKWRFTPATRDGAPIESWRTMTVRFQMSR